MAHFKNRNSNNGNRQQQGTRGMQGGNSPRLPESFDKGELIDLVFSAVPARDGSTFVAAILSDGTAVEPGSYNEYRFNPVLNDKEYYCSVMGGNGKWSALPVYHRELSDNEWVREQPQRACLTAVLVFEMSDERHSGRAPRPISRLPDGRAVIVERGYEEKVQLGVETRVSLIEPRNAGNILFAIPLATVAAKPVPQANVEELPPPVQPPEPLKVTVRTFERKPGTVTVRSLADVVVRDRHLSIYELLSDNRYGIRTTASSNAQVVKANANRIADSLEASVHKNTPKIIRENVFARVDAMGEAVRRALAALGVPQDAKSDGVTENANVQAVASDGPKPKRRNRRRKNGQGAQGSQNATGGNAQSAQGNQSRPNVVRAQGTATIGDAIGNALAKSVESVPPASTPSVTPAPEEAVIELPAVVDPFDNGIDGSDASDVIVPPVAPAAEVAVDEFADAYAGMASEMSVTIEVIKSAIAKSGLSVVDFSEKPKNMKKFYVHQVKASKSA